MRRRPAFAPVPVALVFPTPTDPDFSDAAVNLGVRFAVAGGDGLWIGNRIRYPSSAPSSVGSVTAYSDADAVLAQASMPAWASSGPVDVFWSSPVPVTPGTTYKAAYGPVDRYPYRNSGVYPLTTTVGPYSITVADVNDGRFTYGAAVAAPVTPTGLGFYVSPLVVF